MKCISNLAYVGVWRIYFKFGFLGKVAYFSVLRFFSRVGGHFMLWVHFLFFGVPLRPNKCELSEPNLYYFSIPPNFVAEPCHFSKF